MNDDFVPLDVAVLTISDTRDESSDRSGALLIESLERAGHRCVFRQIIRDELYQIRAEVARLIADPQVQIVITTGGTGFTGRDSTPEAVGVLFDSHIDDLARCFVGSRRMMSAVRPYKAARWQVSPTIQPYSACPARPGPVVPAGTAFLLNSSIADTSPAILPIW